MLVHKSDDSCSCILYLYTPAHFRMVVQGKNCRATYRTNPSQVITISFIISFAHARECVTWPIFVCDMRAYSSGFVPDLFWTSLLLTNSPHASSITKPRQTSPPSGRRRLYQRPCASIRLFFQYSFCFPSLPSPPLTSTSPPSFPSYSASPPGNDFAHAHVAP